MRIWLQLGCIVFRRPEEYVKKKMPLLLMSESDFKDWESLKPDKTEKKYDFIYCCLDDNDDCNPGMAVLY